MDDFLAKPVNVSELLAKLKALDKSREYAESSAQSLFMPKTEVWSSKPLSGAGCIKCCIASNELFAVSLCPI